MKIEANVILPKMIIDVSPKDAVNAVKVGFGFEEGAYTSYRINEAGIVERYYTNSRKWWWEEQPDMNPEVLKAIRVLEEAVKEK